MSFASQNCTVLVVLICLIERVFMSKRVQKKLRVRQVCKSLSLRTSFIKSEVNLNSKLIVGGDAIHSRRFQMIDQENCSVCLSHSSIKGII